MFNVHTIFESNEILDFRKLLRFLSSNDKIIGNYPSIFRSHGICRSDGSSSPMLFILQRSEQVSFIFIGNLTKFESYSIDSNRFFSADSFESLGSSTWKD